MKPVHIEVLHKVKPKLMDLEDKRREMQKTDQAHASYFFLIWLTLSLIIICLHVLFNWSMSTLLMVFSTLTVIIVGLLSVDINTARIRSLQKLVGNTIMQSLQPNWEYHADAHLPIWHFENLGLTQNFKNIEGAHLTRGRHRETDFSFSFLKLANELVDNSASVFEGLIMVCDFSKDIKGKTLVFPDIAQRTLGSWLGKKIQEQGWKGLDLVYLEDTAFEEQFAVYSSDQIEARYILTPSMMERLLELSKKYQNNLSFAFANGKVCVAIDGLLPVKINLDTAIQADGMFHRFSQPIELVKEVIDIMELNTRIWVKN